MHHHCGHEHGEGCCHHHHDEGGHCHHEEPGSGQEHGCEQLEEFFCLAKKAWKKLMVEKIKAEMERMEGEKLNRLAKLIAETKFKKFKAKMEKEKAKYEFMEQLKHMMCPDS